MCGINGIYAFGDRPFDEAVPLISTMNQRIRHRGPDDSGVWGRESDGVWLGHQRLSIIDLSPAGHQPMELPDGTVVTFNGEIYNFRELAASLKNHRLKTGSDTELLLALYREKGEACLDDLIGMFAFAIWDPTKQRLFLARDRIGKKPLYYCHSNGCFAFSSEIRSLFTLPWIRRELDHRALYDFLTFGFCPPPRTMFRGIEKLSPGTSLVVNHDGSLTTNEYWTPSRIDAPSVEDDLLAALQETLDRSVALRMVSDVPVGIFLSGGVDSSGLAALLHRRNCQDVKSYSIRFDGDATVDETKIARTTANRYGFNHFERTVVATEISDMISVVADVLDEPLADPTCVPIYFLAELARENGTKVVLTGDGPDELLLGYRNWQKYLTLYPWYRRLQRSPAAFQAGIGRVLGRVSGQGSEIARRAQRGEEFFWGNAPSFSESEKASFFTAEFAAQSKDWNCHDSIDACRNEYESIYGADASDANWLSYIGLRFVIPNYYLHRADRMGMRHAVELRAPFLDHNFVNLCLSVSPSWKVRNNEGKYILKRLFESELPRDLLYAPKKGFCVPMQSWGPEIMSGYLREHLPSFCDQTGVFEQSRLESELENGSTANVWNLYFLVNWYEKWFA